MKVEWALTPLEKMKGLMFRKSLNKPLVLVLNSPSRYGASIHMGFMKFPIDVVFLDSKKKIVDIALNVRPWTANVTPKKPAKYIVEMKKGTAKRLKIGKTLKIE